MPTRNVPPPQQCVAIELQYSDTKGPLSSDTNGFRAFENGSRSVSFQGFRGNIRHKEEFK